MKILHLAPSLQACGTAGLAADLAYKLQQEGLTDNVLISPPCEKLQGLSSVGVRHVACRPDGIVNYFRNAAQLKYVISRFQPSVIVAYGAGAAWLAGRACNKLPAETRPKIVGALTLYPNLGTTARGLAHCDAFTTVSRHLREVYEDFSPLVRHKGAWVIPYGIYEEQCNPSYGPSEEWIKRWETLYPNPEERLTLCIPGAITPRRGHEDIIPILKNLHESGVRPRVIIAGSETNADADCLSRLRQKLADAGLEKDILWVGADENMRDVYCMSDIVLSLNREASCASPNIQEALSLGCAVAGYDHGAAGELLNAFLPEGRVAPGRPEAIADTIYQWSVYPPATVGNIPYPYRMADTAHNYMSLFHFLHAFADGAPEPRHKTRHLTIHIS